MANVSKENEQNENKILLFSEKNQKLSLYSDLSYI